MFKKAGKHGWAALVPFYNSYVLMEIAWGNGWLMFLMLLPLGNLVFSVLTCIKPVSYTHLLWYIPVQPKHLLFRMARIPG